MGYGLDGADCGRSETNTRRLSEPASGKLYGHSARRVLRAMARLAAALAGEHLPD